MTAQTPSTASSVCFAVGQPLYSDSGMVASRQDRTDELAEVTAARKRGVQAWNFRKVTPTR